MAHRHRAVALLLFAMVARPLGRVTGPAEDLWQIAGDAFGTPALDTRSAYFLSRGSGYELVAIDRTSGRERWRAHVGVPPHETMGSRVVASHGVVVTGGYDLVAFDAVSGARRWRYGPRDSYGFGFYLGALKEGIVYTGSSSGEMFALDLANGSARWIAAVGGKQTTVYAPAVGEEDVVAAFVDFGGRTGRGLTVVNRRTGRERWRQSLPVAVPGERPPAVGGGPILTTTTVVVSGKDGSVHALSRLNGSPIWSWRDRDAVELVEDFRPLAYSSGVIVAGSLSGKVVGLDPATGREVWSHHPSRASVAFALGSGEHSVYVPYVSGLLVALSAIDGRERWRRGGADMFRWAPAADGPFIYFAGKPAGFVSIRDPRDREGG